MNVSRAVVIVALLSSLAGCSAEEKPHEAPYKLDILGYRVLDVPLLGGGPLSRHSLVIRPFVDRRPAADVARTSRKTEGASIEQDGRTWYVATDDQFMTIAGVPEGISDAIAIHLDATHLFESIQISDKQPPPADFVLAGDLVELVGMREARDVSEALIAMQGLPGLVLLVTQQAELRGRAKLENVRLVRVADDRVVWQGNLEGAVDERVMLGDPVVHARIDERVTLGRPVLLAEQQAVDAANRSLRMAVDQLVRALADVALPSGAEVPR